ncbi:hypothetical protein SynWH8103_02418 [Synechococcus sp. WH 8103]|nr:hypothetical protein SynWH8103_02418 [Synechococcus sp. WH 8103]
MPIANIRPDDANRADLIHLFFICIFKKLEVHDLISEEDLASSKTRTQRREERRGRFR